MISIFYLSLCYPTVLVTAGIFVWCYIQCRHIISLYNFFLLYITLAYLSLPYLVFVTMRNYLYLTSLQFIQPHFTSHRLTSLCPISHHLLTLPLLTSLRTTSSRLTTPIPRVSIQHSLTLHVSCLALDDLASVHLASPHLITSSHLNSPFSTRVLASPIGLPPRSPFLYGIVAPSSPPPSSSILSLPSPYRQFPHPFYAGDIANIDAWYVASSRLLASHLMREIC